MLHEIYGVNDFMCDQIDYFEKMGFYVYCPNFLARAPFSYQEAEQAYAYYYSLNQADMRKRVADLIEELTMLHEFVYVIGYSVGGTLAWLCSKEESCDGVIACYGSRIRDHLKITPTCKTLLLFSQESAFSVEPLVLDLNKKQHVTARLFEAEHGFLDSYSSNYNEDVAREAQREIDCFTRNI